MPAERPRVRDRDAFIAAALVVAGVVTVAWLSGFIPGLYDVIALAPVVILGLVAVTVFVLVRTVRR